MEAVEIRAQVSPMVIRMADATIREARRAITHNTGWNDIKRAPYNLPEVEMAGEILFRMFGTFSAAIKYALIEMPVKMDGELNFPGLNYFDQFVKALDTHLSRYTDPDEVSLRESDWVLDKC